MELNLSDADLKPDHVNKNASQIKLNHFKPEVQRAIRVVGRGVLWRKDTHQAINPPRCPCCKGSEVAITLGANLSAAMAKRAGVPVGTFKTICFDCAIKNG